MTALNIPAVIANEAAEALKAAAWKIAARVAARQDARKSEDMFIAAMLSSGDDSDDTLKINALMDAAAEIDGVVSRGTWADGMIRDCVNDIAEAEVKLADTKSALDAVVGTEDHTGAVIAHLEAHRAYARLTNIG